MMKIRKFSKIIESVEEDLTNDIKNVFIDIMDEGVKIRVERYRSFYIIKLHGKKYSDALTILNDLVVATERVKLLGLKFIQSNTETDISIGKDISVYLKYQYGDVDESNNKDVKNWYEFKNYCNNVLGINGIKGDLFRINVVSPEGFPDAVDYWGWEIDAGEGDDVEIEREMVSEFPKYADFFKKILKRKINWAGAWNRDGFKKSDNNALRFDKEGIEVVEKLLEIVKEYPDKIEVILK